jgi:hypothetical protein
MSDTPETDLEDDLYLECASPCIVKESTGAIFTGVLVPAEFARRLERERDQLKIWKEGAISVMPPIQEIGEEIGVVFGQTIHDKILPELIRRREAIERAREIIANLASEQNTPFNSTGEALMAKALETQRSVIDWQSQSDAELRLRCGELTAQEIRTIRAILRAIVETNSEA